MNTIPRDMFSDLDRFFNGGYQPAKSQRTQSAYSPRIDVIEHDDSYQLIAELPGVEKSNIAITVQDATLTISANNSAEEKTDTHTRVLRRERQLGQFSRSFKVGKDIQQDNIQAQYKDGLLILTVPKVKPAAPVKRTIEIH